MGQRKMSGLCKRGNIWHIDKQIGGKRIQCSTKTADLNQAEAVLAYYIEQERKSRIFGEPNQYRFVDAAKRYIKEDTKKSLDRDIQDLKAVMPFVGNLLLKQVHLGSLQPFIDKRKKAGIKSSTVNRTLSVVRSVLRKAASAWRDDNGHPWLASVPEIPKLDWNDKRKPYPIDRAEQQLLMKHLSLEVGRIALWLINTGLRSQEFLNLRWSWRRYVPELDVYVFDVPGQYTKNKQDRVLVLNSLLQAQLDDMKQTDSDFVFPGKDGKKRDRVLTTNWKTARKRAADEYEELTGKPADWGFRNLRVHDLRHTFATRLRRSGASNEIRKDLLAHVNTDITTYYSAGELKELLEAVECLVKSDKFPPTTPVNKGKVLQFPYNGNKESCRKVAK